MNETTHRFLQTIVGRLPEGKIAELRLFPAIRQGGIESAVAVVAVEQPEVPPVPAEVVGDAALGDEDGFAAQGHEEVEVETIEMLVVVEEMSEGAPEGATGVADQDGDDRDDASDAADVGDAGDSVDASPYASATDDSPYADEPNEPQRAATGRIDTVAIHSELVVTELADRPAPDAIADALDVEVTRIMADPFNIHAEGSISLGADDATLTSRETPVGRSVERDDSGDEFNDAGGIADASHEDEGNSTEQEIDHDAAALMAAHSDAAPIGDREVERSSGGITADAAPDGTAREESIALGDILALPARVVDDLPLVPPPDPNKRYAILTASYRLVLKGPDRGKWEVDIIHEADAPLATVERVARGVARRAGDESDPEHFSGDQLRSVIEKPSWATSA